MKIVGVLILVLLISCNEKKKKKSELPTTPAELGTYELCSTIGSKSIRYQVYLNETSLINSIFLYDSPNCSGSNVMTEYDSYSYTKSGTTLNLRVEGATVTANGYSSVSTFNVMAFCGFSNWANYKPKNVLGKKCEDTTLNKGDHYSVIAYKNAEGMSIKDRDETLTYTKVAGLDFSDKNESISTGTYLLSDGITGVHLSLNSPNYTIKVFDEVLDKAYSQTGTFTSADNEIVFTPVSENVSCFGTTPMTLGFNKTNFSLTLEGIDGSSWLLEKADFSVSDFEAGFLNSTFTSGCIQ